jgi:hypothetical protein
MEKIGEHIDLYELILKNYRNGLNYLAFVSRISLYSSLPTQPIKTVVFGFSNTF